MGTQVFLYQALPVIASMPALPCRPQSREKGAVQAAKEKGEGEELSSSPGKSRTQGRGLCKHLVRDKMWHCCTKAVPGSPHEQNSAEKSWKRG